MTFRIYIVPTIGSGSGPTDPIRPAYLPDVVWGCITYGSESVALVYADVTTEQHNALITNADVLSAPINLDSVLTSNAVTTIRAFLENLNIPAGWVNASRTYRDVVRIVGGVFQVNQSYTGQRNIGMFSEGLDLTRTYTSLSQSIRNALVQIGVNLDLDSSNITGTSTLRDILVDLGQQFLDRPIILAGQSI